MGAMKPETPGVDVQTLGVIPFAALAVFFAVIATLCDLAINESEFLAKTQGAAKLAKRNLLRLLTLGLA